MVLNEDANGRLVDLKQGTTIEISLSEKPGAGYVWLMRSPSDSRILKGNSAGEVTAGGPPGANSTRAWKFVAAEPGETDLEFDYGRQWEPRPIRQFHVHIRVQAQ